MCKLFAISETAGIPRDRLDAILLAVHEEMKDQRDGFGIATNDFIQRSLTSDFLGLKVPVKFANMLGAASLAGTIPAGKFCGPLIVHSRIATNGVTWQNAHPFAVGSWIIAHNGIVNPTPRATLPPHEQDAQNRLQLECEGTNDSEYLARVIARHGFANIHRYVEGTLAVVAIHRGRLEVIRGEYPHLYAMVGETEYSPVYFGTTRAILWRAAKVVRGKDWKKMRVFLVPGYRVIIPAKMRGYSVKPWGRGGWTTSPRAGGYNLHSDKNYYCGLPKKAVESAGSLAGAGVKVENGVSAMRTLGGVLMSEDAEELPDEGAEVLESLKY